MTLPLPFILWLLTFGYPALNFWLKISISTLVLMLISFRHRENYKFRLDAKAIVAGLISALMLYLFFWSGYQLFKNYQFFSEQINSIYSLKAQASDVVIASLLLFPISPAEELYWRGLIQDTLCRIIGSRNGVLLASLLYSSIHIFTFNYALIIVALIAGLTWGYIYYSSRNILVSITSHITFNELIFILLIIK